MNRQGPDIGDQYRSVIFFHSSVQEKTARKVKGALEKSQRFKKPIATQIVPATEFFPVEEHHQKYLMKRGRGSCHI